MKKTFTLLLFLFIFISLAPAQVQILNPANYKTQDNTPNLIPSSGTPTSEPYYGYCWSLQLARDRFGDSVFYYEYAARATWWTGSSTFAYPFSGATDFRQTSRLSGETINGNYAMWLFDVDTSTTYLVYNYILASGNAATNAYYMFYRFGESLPVDSFRYDFRKNNNPGYGKPGTSAVTYGVWVPLGSIKLYKGSKAFSIKLGADTLTGNAILRADAIRILKSNVNGPDLEFGRRAAQQFDSTRVEEEWGEIGLGETLDREIPVYNLGNQNLVISKFSFILNTGRFSSETQVPITIAPGEKSSIKIRFRPYQEEFSTDTLVIYSNDAQEPEAKLAISGSGVNYYFIMNASDPNAQEPHFRAPFDLPNDPKRPRYQEDATVGASWLSSLASPYPYPIPGGNLKSRVNTGALGFPSWCSYSFTLPDDKFGTYILDYAGPYWSPNGAINNVVKVTTPFVTDTASATFNEQNISTYWVQIGTTWQMNAGAPTVVTYNNIQANAQFLRSDLLRIRKIPTNPTIASEFSFTTYYYSNVSVYPEERLKNPLSNKKKFEINSNGESLIRLDTIYLKKGKFYKFIENMKFPIEVPAVNGKYTFTVEFNPDAIMAGYIDTIIVKSNAYNIPQFHIRLYGTGVGDMIVSDDKDVSTTLYPPTPVDFAAAPEPANYGKWYYAAGGNADRRLLGYIYQLKGDPDNIEFSKKNLAYVEWFPEFPVKQGGTAVADSFNVYAYLPASSSNSNPVAKYVIYEYGGKSTIKIMSQNAYDATLNPTGVPASGELFLGKYQFLRGGKDAHNSGALFGHVELWNDTSLVTDFYKAVYPNPAKKDSFLTRADAIYFREAAKPTQVFVVEPAVPKEFSLSQNYPNPFNPSTQIRFALPKEGKVEIKIYDMLGREVRTLINEKLVAGTYTLEWNGRNNYGLNVSTGAYFYRISTDKHVMTKKMLLMK
jgi:hypothetical protein